MFTRNITVFLCGAWLWLGSAASAAEVEPRAGIEIQARGPVHEAFADPALPNPEPGPIAGKKPPEAIPEIPPDQKPEGANIQWIPGYWAWDDERKDFLWVSGVWRKVPVGQRWVPGYWNEADAGWQWVRGFWAPADREELPYQPAPPASVDNGPNAPAPNPDSIYTPGAWLYQANRYAWQPGTWQNAQPGAVWVPTRYSWTPLGYVCLPGYWDYPLDDRGLLFAPAAFSQPYWNDPNWSYQPSYVVNPAALLGSLFVRPGWGNYYYGDYYGAPYLSAGYQPWYQWGPSFQDPLFGYYSWRNRGNSGWYAGLRNGYQGRLAGQTLRPARTFAQQNTLIQNNRAANIGALRMVTPLNQFHDANVRLTRVSAELGREHARLARDLRESSVNRSRIESAARRGSGLGTSRSLTLPRSTTIVRSAGASPRAPGRQATPAPRAAPRAAPVQHVAPRAAPVQHTAPRAAPVQHTAPRAAPVQHTAPRAAPVQHTAPRAAPVQHTAPRAAPVQHTAPRAAPVQHTAPRAAPVQHTAPRAAPVQHTAPHAAPVHHTAPRAGLRR